VQDFIAERWMTTMAKPKQDVSLLDIGHVLILLALVPISQTFHKCFPTEALLRRILETRTELKPIAELLKGFDDQERIMVALISSTEKRPARFQQLIELVGAGT
jgi:hypothetical protein